MRDKPQWVKKHCPLLVQQYLLAPECDHTHQDTHLPNLQSNLIHTIIKIMSPLTYIILVTMQGHPAEINHPQTQSKTVAFPVT